MFFFESRERILKCGRWIVSAVIFFALPLLMIAFGLGTRFDGIEEAAFERAFNKLERAVLNIRKYERTDEYLAFLLRQITAQARRKPDFIPYLKRYLNQLRQRFPGVFSFYVVGRNSKLVSGLSEPASSQFVLNILCQALRKPEQEKYKFYDSKFSILRTFVGQDAISEEFFANNEQLFTTNSSDEKRRFFYMVDEKLGIFAHANEPPGWEFIGIKDRVRQVQKFSRLPEITIGLKTPEMPNPPSEIFRAASEFKKSSKSNQILADSLISITRLESSALLWASIPKSRVIDTQRDRFFVTTIVTAVFAIFAIMSFSVMVGGRPFFFSIRWRLIVLFCFASSLPLLVIFIAGMDYLDQKYKTDVRLAFEALERGLRGIDARFPLIKNRIQVNLLRLFKDKNFESPSQQEATKQTLYKIKNFGFECNLFVYDKKGKVAFTTERPELVQKSKVIGGMMETLIATLNQEEVKVNVAASVIESMSGGRSIIGMFSRSLNRITDITLGKNSAWTFIRPCYSATKKATHLIFCNWDKMRVERTFLQDILRKEEKTMPGIRFMATEKSFAWRVPQDFEFQKEIRPLLIQLIIKQSAINSKFYTGKKDFFVCGIKPKELPYSYLFAVQSDEEIRAGIRILKYRLGLVALISALITIFLGLMLAQKFLVPVGDLSHGIHAIENRNFNHSVPVHTPDELGEMSLLMNHVIEGMKDLEVARIVQENLFPQQPLDIGGYRIFGKSRAMCDIGGDYFDYFQIGGKIVGLIGDVSGHGVSAALIMGMAKCAFTTDEHLGRNLNDNLDSFNRFMLKTIKRKKMMTLFHYSVDTEIHTLQYSNAGHNTPCLWRSETKTSDFLRVGAMPLGTRAKTHFEIIEVGLRPGDALLLYTDGLVEAADAKGEVLGYPMAQKWFEEICHLDPITAVDEMFRRFEEFTRGTKPNDDVSIICLKRLDPQKGAKDAKDAKILVDDRLV